MDVKTAFLHGDLEEEINIKQPKGFPVKGKKELVCKLKKYLYGLKQSPRMWYQKFDTFIWGFGFTRSLQVASCRFPLPNPREEMLSSHPSVLPKNQKQQQQITVI